ncbi:hypothetical protein GCM10009608_68990 [Pseudonocardia alaniniphila]
MGSGWSFRYRWYTSPSPGDAAVASRFKIPKLEKKTFRGWTFVLVVGVLLAFIAIIDRGGLNDQSAAADGSTGCQLEVAADQLNVRAAPDPDSALLQTLVRGDRVDGTRIVTNGFRELEGNQWAADQFLTPLPDTNCA